MPPIPYTQVLFQQVDEEGNAITEALWTLQIGNSNQYRIENIPFLLQNVAYHDIVVTEVIEEKLHATGITKESGHSTIRIYFQEVDKERVNKVSSFLQAQNCTMETSANYQLIAVDIPPNVAYTPIQAYLEDGENKGWWEYEEGCLAH